MNKVAVLIPHYNNPKGLLSSILSIDEQADVFIVDDGSNNKPEEESIIKAKNEKIELVFLYLEVNKGIEEALNVGLKEIVKRKYKYVARLDCGDKHVNFRLKKQSEFLEQNPSVYLIGSYVNFISFSGELLFQVKPPILHKKIKKKMYLNCMFIHPSVMFRTEAIHEIGYYPYDFKAAEDYAYFFKFVNHFQTANIPEVLVEVEANPQGISTKSRKKQVITRMKVIRQNFYFGYYPIYGLIRNFILLLLPLAITTKVKKVVFNG